MPETIPQFSMEAIGSLRNLSYPEIAAFILKPYMYGLISDTTLLELCRDAYDYDVPLESVNGHTFLMRLDRGPTASFKDFAARLMALLFGVLMKDSDRKLIILTATSGDTGSAIANAFYSIPGISVMVLFPIREVSDQQRKQMTTLRENITLIGVEGKFDDCQALVKQAFSDPGLKMLNLTSANSINIGRLLPQIIYYFYAYARLAEIGEPVTFCVPSGNFGNMMGALLAKNMGLPVQRLFIVTNANDEVPRYIQTGIYEKIAPSRLCISNAMNVGHPSNFVRVIDLYGGWMDEKGVIHKQPDLDHLRRDLWAVSINDMETRKAICEAWQDHKILLEPHGAVAWAGFQQYNKQRKSEGLVVLLETAHPAKFPEEIRQLLHITPEIPASLEGLDEKEERYSMLGVNYPAFRSLLKEKYLR